MCPSRPHTESFTWWIHGSLVEGYRESYQCTPAVRLNYCVLSGEHHLGSHSALVDLLSVDL
ncbi:hypothetical protein NP493_612g00010 [Ridgeia piscesae]|uniref:Uncharacterized protein n=1 Tax=Ridgeia piscesae TaxID=27915 RepID=A0AAD9NP52_RIDPI|nr:hypothetical protein NP493_612g00010 [Ridgeia piscesae]